MGTRNRSMIRYYSDFWREFSGSGRYGYTGVTVFIKLLRAAGGRRGSVVQKVGVVYREVGNPTPVTATGYYFARMPDGAEEWHRPSAQHAAAGHVHLQCLVRRRHLRPLLRRQQR